MPILLAVFVLGFPPARPTVRQELEAQYAALNGEFLHKDEGKMRRIFTADFAGEAPGGNLIGIKSAQATYGGLMAIGDRVIWPKKIVKLRMERGEAVATVTGHYQCFMEKKLFHEMFITEENRWRKTPKGWKLAGWKYLRFVEFIDGKDVSPPKWR